MMIVTVITCSSKWWALSWMHVLITCQLRYFLTGWHTISMIHAVEEIWLSGFFHHSSEQWLKSGCTKHNMTHYAFSRSEHWSWSSGTGHWLQAWFCTQKAVQTQCNSSAQTVLDNVPYMHVLSAVLETQAGGVTLSAAPSSSSHVRQSHVQSSICTSDAACINRHV